MKKIASERNYRLLKEAFNWPGSKEKTRQKFQANAQKGGLQENLPLSSNHGMLALLNAAKIDLERLAEILKKQGDGNTHVAIEKTLSIIERRPLAIRRSLQRLGLKGDK